jgi:hypothetical protein
MGQPTTIKRRTARAAAIGSALLGVALLTGCSSSGPSEPSGTSRSLSEFFTGGTSFAQTAKPDTATSGASGTAAAESPAEFDPNDCPTVDVRQGASTFAVNTASKNPEDSALRYQGSFSQTARECRKNGNMLTIKLGVQGRLILGPAGTPGQVEVPLRLALVEEGIQPKTVWTKFYQVPVTIGEGQPSVSFTHIEDDLTVPMPTKDKLEAYIVYVGFDPLSASRQPKKTPPPRAARPKPSG